MLTGEIRSQVDQIWNAFWSGGMSNVQALSKHIRNSEKNSSRNIFGISY
jgi:hypothetical protein